MDLYNEQISEFINWNTCRNELTGESLGSEDIPASGKVIRELLTNHLKIPFVVYLDKDDNKLKFFSSEYARDLYLSHKSEDNNEEYLDLVIFEMVKPSEYVVDINEAFLTANRYLVAGDENQEGLKMAYTWDVKLGDRSEVDNLIVTYVITCPSGKTY